MATRTATKNGFASDTTVWGAAAPVAGDTVNLVGFTVTFDYSVALASLVTNGGKLILSNGNIVLDITAATLTGHLFLQGSPRNFEFANATAGQTALGVGGVG